MNAKNMDLQKSIELEEEFVYTYTKEGVQYVTPSEEWAHMNADYGSYVYQYSVKLNDKH
jgi:lipid II:glycine glycyltransferase (peptidoglycan interpeptide bridge formation enzyme)